MRRTLVCLIVAWVAATIVGGHAAAEDEVDQASPSPTPTPEETPCIPGIDACPTFTPPTPSPTPTPTQTPTPTPRPTPFPEPTPEARETPVPDGTRTPTPRPTPPEPEPTPSPTPTPTPDPDEESVPQTTAAMGLLGSGLMLSASGLIYFRYLR